MSRPSLPVRATARVVDGAPGSMRIRVQAERNDDGRRTVTIELTLGQLRALMAGERVPVSSQWEHFA